MFSVINTVFIHTSVEFYLSRAPARNSMFMSSCLSMPTYYRTGATNCRYQNGTCFQLARMGSTIFPISVAKKKSCVQEEHVTMLKKYRGAKCGPKSDGAQKKGFSEHALCWHWLKVDWTVVALVVSGAMVKTKFQDHITTFVPNS